MPYISTLHVVIQLAGRVGKVRSYEGSVVMSLSPQQGQMDVKAELITLKVLDQHDRRVFHTMKTTDKLQALMDKYYAKAPEVSYGTGTFLFDGSIRVVGWKTPADIDLKDEDEIDFFEYSEGGRRGDDVDA
ncbi:hypothetical protein EJB05_53284, partial [Eragrostis curvula]